MKYENKTGGDQMKNYLLMLGLLSFSSFTYAEGGMASGGGKGLVCFKNEQTASAVKLNKRYVRDKDLANITKIEMLDLHYAKAPQGLNRRISKIIAGNDFVSLIDKMINRVELTIPVLGKELRKSEKLFDNNIIFRSSAIEMASDENDIAINESDLCVLTTLAKQYKDDGRYFIHIDERLFFHPVHSDVSKATLLFHEYLYALARSKGEVDSRGVREIVSIFVKNDKDIKIIDIAKKVFESNLTPFKANFKTPEGDRRNNYTIGQPIDYTLFSMPMNFLFDWVASLYTTTNHLIGEFDNSRPSGIKSLEELTEGTSKLLYEININKQVKYISEAKTLLSKHSDLLTAVAPIRYANLLNEVNKYNQARISQLEQKVVEVLDDQKDLIIEYELKGQKSLAPDQVDALFTILKEVAYDRINLLKTNRATSIACNLNYCSSEYDMNQDLFVETLLDERYFLLSDYDPLLHKGFRRNIGWVRASIYKVYHDLKLFDLSEIYMQQINL